MIKMVTNNKIIKIKMLTKMEKIKPISKKRSKKKT